MCGVSVYNWINDVFFLLSMKEKSKNDGCMAGAGVVLHCFMFLHTNKHECLELNF